MKKIGILTFHRANNYGAVLQCFALQNYLKKLGCDVQVIDYRQKYIEAVYSTFNLKTLFKCITHPIDLLKYIYRIPKRITENYKYHKFRDKYLQLSTRFNPKEIQPYDVVFHGSDQIWNPKLTGGHLDNIYLGFYKLKERAVKIAYAISFEDKPFSKKEELLLKSGLNNFQSISLREPTLRKILSTLTDKNIISVVDPTLLLDDADYENITENVEEKKPYVLVYAVGPTELALQVAKRVAKEKYLNVINISNKNISPTRFLGYFKSASFVVTVSFHGTVFSLLFKRDFYTIATGRASDVRYYDLLRIFGMSNRCISSMPKSIETINYAGFNQEKERYVKLSKDFILQNIN